MKQTLKNAGFAVLGCALLFSTAACNNTSTTTATSDSTATASTTTTTTPVASPDTSNKMAAANNNADATFVTDVAKANAGEIDMLQAGIDKGTSKMLKTDATKMIADHKKLAQQAQDYAAKKNITLPAASPMDMGDMNSKTGKDWDKAWVDKMVDGHQQTIARFEKGQNEVQDPELKSWITATLPTLHAHLDMVTKLQASMK